MHYSFELNAFSWTVSKTGLAGGRIFERDVLLDIRANDQEDWWIDSIYYRGGRLGNPRMVFLRPEQQLFKDIEEILMADDMFVSVVSYEIDEQMLEAA